MKSIMELLKPMLESHKSMIVVFKHRLEVQTYVCRLIDLGEIWDLIGSASEGFPTYFIVQLACHSRR